MTTKNWTAVAESSFPWEPYTPRHKGKVERGVAYVQENALKGRVFESIVKQNDYLANWERTVADTRIHGTLKCQVGKLFESVERAALQPLPRERFPFYHEARRVVSRDGPIEVAKSFYSVPPEYVTWEVWSRWDSRMVRVFNQKWERITLANFRDVRRLEDFDFAFNTAIKKSTIFELATCRFIREHQDLLIVGPPGTGKSHIAQALGHVAIRNGLHVYYRSIFDVVRDFLHDEAMEGYEKTLQRYLKPDLLIIDDMGMKQLPKRSGEYLFEIISHPRSLHAPC